VFSVSTKTGQAHVFFTRFLVTDAAQWGHFMDSYSSFHFLDTISIPEKGLLNQGVVWILTEPVNHLFTHQRLLDDR
jgi:hypothetical protein